MTSSARVRIDTGNDTPIALADVTFTARANLVGASTGKSLGRAAALAIFTVGAASVLGLPAVHEAPFEPPVFIAPGPIADVLLQVPL